MKRIALFAVVGLVLAACSAKETTPVADSAAAPAAAAPAMDSAAMMAPPADSAMMAPPAAMDTTKH